MAKDLIDINYRKEKDVFYRDFGNFKGDGTIKVDKKEWEEYVMARMNFELKHAKLEKKVKK